MFINKSPIIETVPGPYAPRRYKLNFRIEESYTAPELTQEIDNLKRIAGAYESNREYLKL